MPKGPDDYDSASPVIQKLLDQNARFVAVAGIAALAGKRQVEKATPPMPEQTVETVKEDVEWAKTRTSSART